MRESSLFPQIRFFSGERSQSQYLLLGLAFRYPNVINPTILEWDVDYAFSRSRQLAYGSVLITVRRNIEPLRFLLVCFSAVIRIDSIGLCCKVRPSDVFSLQ